MVLCGTFLTVISSESIVAVYFLKSLFVVFPSLPDMVIAASSLSLSPGGALSSSSLHLWPSSHPALGSLSQIPRGPES